jgi:4-amino-4-deoxy-L-arabinose transferase-like glycosyltransferase
MVDITSWISGAVGLLAGFLLPLLGLAATAYVLGRTVTRRLLFAGRLERVAVSTALGLALAAHLLLLLGLLGLLKPLPVLLLAVVVHATGIPAWRELWADPRGASSGRARWLGLVAALGLAPLVLLALYPPTAFDATLYHLPFARAFAESGGVSFLADRRFPVFPQANEILFAAVMLFGRDVAAHGVQLLATLLTAGLLVAWGREAFPSYKPAGWLAAAVFLGNPIVVHLAGSGYIEPGLTLFVTASLYALDRWRSTGAREWLALSALFGATAADSKYLGLFFLGIAALLTILAGGRYRSAAARLRETLLFGSLAVVLLAPWYLRIYLYTGNPVFPFLPQVFGSNLWDSVSLGGVAEPLLRRLVRWARLPWDVLFERGRYNQQPPFSPVYLAALPLLAFGAARDSRVRYPLLIAGLSALAFLWLPPDSRYLVPVLPLTSLAVAGSLAAAVRSWPRLAFRQLAAVLCFGGFLPGWLYAGYRIVRQGPPPVTARARETYLARSLPVYPAIAFLNRTRGSAYTLWALHAENMTYFAAGRFLGDWFGPAGFSRVLANARDAGSLHRELRRLGADYLLLPADMAPLKLPISDGELRRWFQLVYQDANARVYALRPNPLPPGHEYPGQAPGGSPPSGPAGRTPPRAGTAART